MVLEELTNSTGVWKEDNLQMEEERKTNRERNGLSHQLVEIVEKLIIKLLTKIHSQMMKYV